MSCVIIAIDGPAGSGKSTVSLKVAQALGYTFLTTGAFYRGMALLSLKYSTEQTGELLKLYSQGKLRVVASIQGTEVFIDDENVTSQLSDEKTAKRASTISALPEIRQALLEPQRSFAKPPGLVAEGRDCGTVVFPESDVKIFLTASLDARALRREGFEAKESLQSRDHADSTRAAAPLAMASDAIHIDTSNMTIEQVVQEILEVVRSKCG
ncbi:MAG: (d)CMP kinase [Oligoflexia bacterium]|nr:(d)CMP kinase [Oligoflexia bacterium]